MILVISDDFHDLEGFLMISTICSDFLNFKLIYDIKNQFVALGIIKLINELIDSDKDSSM